MKSVLNMIIDYDYDERYKNSGAMQNQDKKKTNVHNDATVCLCVN